MERLRGADEEKKCNRLSAFAVNSQVDEALQVQARRLADGNPRLLEWLDKVLLNLDPPQPPLKRGENSLASPFLSRSFSEETGGGSKRGEQNAVAEILARLEADPVELREQVLAKSLLEQIDRTLEEILRRGLVYDLPVPRDALAAVCEEIPNLDKQINRAVALGLLEVSPDESLRVPRILPLKLPEDAESLHQQAAEVLYRLWWEETETLIEEQLLEIHRLALRGKVEKIAIKIATTLTDGWYYRSRFLEAVEVCRGTLAIVENYRLLHNLAISEQQIGLVDKALEHHQQVLNLCPPEDETQKAATFHQLAILKADTGQIEEAIALYQQSLEIKERSGNPQGKAATLHCLASLKADTGQIEEAIALFQQSLDIDERIGDAQGKAATLHELGSLKANTGQIEEAIALYQQSLEIDERIGNAQGKAATLHALGSLKANTGRIEQAITLYQQSLEITERIGNAQGKAATLHQLGRLKANTGQIEQAIALYQQSLEITERIGNAQGKAATLHQLGRLKANTGQIEEAIALFQQSLEITERIGDAQGKAATLHQLGRLKANSGQIEEAIALFQQSLEIKEGIGNVQGKAATLAMLGQLLANEKGDFDTALNYLQQSLEILQRVQSPDTETVRRIIARLQQQTDNRG